MRRPQLYLTLYCRKECNVVSFSRCLPTFQKKPMPPSLIPQASWHYKILILTPPEHKSSQLCYGSSKLISHNSSIFWDTIPCGPLKVKSRFRVTWRLHFQGWIIRKETSMNYAAKGVSVPKVGWLSAECGDVSQKMGLLVTAHSCENAKRFFFTACLNMYSLLALTLKIKSYILSPLPNSKFP
jgi:hypothetical protein